MINAKAKGNKAQRIFATFLEKNEWETEIVRNTRKTHADYFGVADILAIRECWRVVQVKSNKTDGALKLLRKKKLPKGTMKTVAVRMDGKGGQPVRWRIIEIDENGGTTEYQLWERDMT